MNISLGRKSRWQRAVEPARSLLKGKKLEVNGKVLSVETAVKPAACAVGGLLVDRGQCRRFLGAEKVGTDVLKLLVFGAGYSGDEGSRACYDQIAAIAQAAARRLEVARTSFRSGLVEWFRSGASRSDYSRSYGRVFEVNRNQRSRETQPSIAIAGFVVQLLGIKLLTLDAGSFWHQPMRARKSRRWAA